MPGTVKSGLLSDADKSYKCDSQEKVCWILNLPLDKGHFITEYKAGGTYVVLPAIGKGDDEYASIQG